MAPNSMSEAGPSGCVVKTKKIEGKNNPNYGKVMKFWLWNFLKKKFDKKKTIKVENGRMKVVDHRCSIFKWIKRIEMEKNQ